MTIDLSTVVTVLFSAGGIATIQRVVTVWMDIRAGARTGQKQVVSNMREWNAELDEERHRLATDRDYWHEVAADRAAQLREAGLDPRTLPRPTRSRRRENGRS